MFLYLNIKTYEVHIINMPIKFLYSCKVYVVNNDNIDKNKLCALCYDYDICNIQVSLQDNPKYFPFGICNNCIDENKYNQFMSCINCNVPIHLDFTKLKNGDIILGGIFAFCCCYKCLTTIKTNIKPYNVFGWRCLSNIFELMCGTSDEEEYDKMQNTPIRYIGNNICEEKYYNNGFTKNEIEYIENKLASLMQNDMKKFGYKGNLTIENIKILLNYSNRICYNCKDNVDIIPKSKHCCYQFSIDRIDDNKPHNIKNVLVSCYYCNCIIHKKFSQQNKICKNGCHENKREYIPMKNVKNILVHKYNPFI